MCTSSDQIFALQYQTAVKTIPADTISYIEIWQVFSFLKRCLNYGEELQASFPNITSDNTHCESP